MYEWLYWFLFRLVLPVVGWIGVNMLVIIVYEWSSRSNKTVRSVGNSLF